MSEVRMWSRLKRIFITHSEQLLPKGRGLSANRADENRNLSLVPAMKTETGL
jgi:hypothetical protein